MTAQLTPQALEAIGASGECTAPIFRMAPGNGSGERPNPFDILDCLHRRFTLCAALGATAGEAYDSFYQELVMDAIAAPGEHA